MYDNSDLLQSIDYAGGYSVQDEFKILLISKDNLLYNAKIQINSGKGKVEISENDKVFHNYTICFRDIISFTYKEISQEESEQYKMKHKPKNQQRFNLLLFTIIFYPNIQYKQLVYNFPRFKIVNKHTRKRKQISFFEKGNKLHEILVDFNLQYEQTNMGDLNDIKHFNQYLFNSSFGSASKLFPNQSTEKRMYIIINPVSGCGKAEEIFLKTKVFYESAEIKYDVLISKNKEQIINAIDTLNTQQYNGIVIYGGDGTVHNVINAVFNRNDYNDVISTIAIGVVPCGKSNSFANTILHDSSEENHLDSYAYIISKGITKKCDVQEIEGLYPNNQLIYSISNITWGISSKISSEGVLKSSDINTNDLNKQAVLSYLPLAANIESIPNIKLPIHKNKEFIHIKDKFSLFFAANVPITRNNYHSHPKAKMNNTFTDIVLMKENEYTKKKLLNVVNEQMKQGSYINKLSETVDKDSGVEYIQTSFWRLTPLDVDRNTEDGFQGDLNLTNLNDSVDGLYVDGEKYPLETIQVRVPNNKKIKVFCLPSLEQL